MSVLSQISRIAFGALKATDALIGLPKSLAESLHFRRSWRTFLKNPAQGPTLWIHGASVGELEDLASFYLSEDHIKSSGYDTQKLIVTSSSVSAEGFLRKLQSSGKVLYAGPIPPEDSVQILSFLKELRPELLILSHSDIWPLLLEVAQKNALAKGIVWLPAKALAAQNLLERVIQPDKLKAVGLRREDDRDILQSRLHNLYPDTQIVWIGNARLERIQSRIIEQKSKDHPALESHRALPDRDKVSILLGSAWPEDASVLGEALKQLSPEEQQRFQLVVLPHITDDIHMVASIQHLLPMSRVLAVQGILLESYQSFDIAFVGGGFRTGLHNVLEPVLWSLPVICGPRLKQQPEAPWLEKKGALLAISSSAELVDFLRRSLDATEYKKMKERSAVAAHELAKSVGASKRLSDLLCEFKLPPKVNGI